MAAKILFLLLFCFLQFAFLLVPISYAFGMSLRSICSLPFCFVLLVFSQFAFLLFAAG